MPLIPGFTTYAKAQIDAMLQAVNTALGAKYTRPGTGIPASDLSTAAQAALTKGASAVQSVNGSTPDGTGNVAITAGVASVNSKTGAVVLAAADVGASPTGAYVKPGGGIPNSDLATPGITQATADGRYAAASALATKADLVGGVVPSSQISALSTHETVPVANRAAMLALTTSQVQPGDTAVIGSTAPAADRGLWQLTATDPSQIGNWLKLDVQTGVSSVNGQTGGVVLAAADVGASPTGAYVKPSGGIPNSDLATPLSKASIVATGVASTDIGGTTPAAVTAAIAAAPTATDERVTRQPIVWMATQLTTLAKAQAWKAAGGTHSRVPFYWDRMQPTATGPLAASAITEMRGWIDYARQAGLRVMLEINVASTPSWVRSAVPAFQDQNGNLYTQKTSTDTTADNIRDFVFSQAGRIAEADLIARCLRALPISDLALVDGHLIGGGPLNELSYPNPHWSGTSTPNWWCFSASAAAGNADLADGVIGRPASFTTTAVPWGSVNAGTSTPDGTDPANPISVDRANAAWYTAQLTNYMQFLVSQYRLNGWTAGLWLMLPSFGVRRDVGDGDSNYRFETAAGADWEAHIQGLPDAQVYLWQTNADRQDNATVNGPQDWAPFRALAAMARKYGADSYMMGENAAGAGDAKMTAMFTDPNGPVAWGARGLCFVSMDDFQSGTSGLATLSNLATLMGNRPAAGKLRTGNVPRPLPRTGRGMLPSDVGLLGWTIDPATVGTGNRAFATGSSAYYTRIRLSRGVTRGGQLFFAAAGASLTAASVALLALDGTVLAVTADLSTALSTAGNAGAPFNFAWANPALIPADGDYLIAYTVSGTTGPAMLFVTNGSSAGSAVNMANPAVGRRPSAGTGAAGSVAIPNSGTTFPAPGSKLSLAAPSVQNTVLLYTVL